MFISSVIDVILIDTQYRTSYDSCSAAASVAKPEFRLAFVDAAAAMPVVLNTTACMGG